MAALVVWMHFVARFFPLVVAIVVLLLRIIRGVGSTRVQMDVVVVVYLEPMDVLSRCSPVVVFLKLLL